ncbi:MAG: bifunctional 4-hydroxy-2-oxoglutarate aldolase/2-dehydro-3-deoxy-phosphogluconate aldolase [bacterium]
MSILEILQKATIIPVIELNNITKAERLATILHNAGLHVIEMTMRSENAFAVMQAMKKVEPDLLIGMGTITSPATIVEAMVEGADFLVTPGTTPKLLEQLAEAAIPSLPGVATASEAMQAAEYGFSALKLFPAEAIGGIAYLNSLYGPLPNLQFCPTGGISMDNAADYLHLPNVACVGGSWMASKADLAAENWTAIKQKAQEAAAIGLALV